MSEPDPKELELELAKARATIDSLTEQRDSLQRKLDEAQAALQAQQGEVGRLTALVTELEAVRAERDDLRRRLDEVQAALQAQQGEIGRLTALVTELEAVRAERDDLRRRLDDVQAALQAQQGEIGRLTALVTELEAVKAERDSLRQQLSDAQAALGERVAEQVRAQISDVTDAHTEEIGALTGERDDLRRRIQELEAQGMEGATEITPSDLAGHFAQVLSSVAEQPAPAGQPYAAAVTGLTVQAKALLQAPTETGGDVRLVTVDPGKVDPAHLSTVNLDLKLVPRLAQPAEPAG